MVLKLAEKVAELYKKIDPTISDTAFSHCTRAECNAFQRAVTQKTIKKSREHGQLPEIKTTAHAGYREDIAKYLGENTTAPKIPIVSVVPANVYNALLVHYRLIPKP